MFRRSEVKSPVYLRHDLAICRLSQRERGFTAMTDFTLPTLKLTHAAVLTMLGAAVSKAEEIGQPQCIVIVDASGETLGEIRMNGAKFLSRKSVLASAHRGFDYGAFGCDPG